MRKAYGMRVIVDQRELERCDAFNRGNTRHAVGAAVDEAAAANLDNLARQMAYEGMAGSEPGRPVGQQRYQHGSSPVLVYKYVAHLFAEFFVG